jgi:selenocysteine lyase/cysteine desulfurase
LAEYDVIFTSNTTEAINLAAESLHKESGPGSQSIVVNTLLEHNSNELPWRKLPSFSLIRLPVDAEGFVDLNGLETLLRAYNQQGQHGKKRIKLVTVSGASNVLGICNNLVEISQIVHRYGAHLLVDAAQLVAHRKVKVEACGIDYLAFSAHKVYAPFGAGVLLVRKGLLHFSPAELELIQASSEENVGGIAALGKALLLLHRIGLDLIQQEEQALTAQALRGLAQILGITVYGIKDPASVRFTQKGGVIVFRLEGMMANRVARELAEQGGIGVRYGCHCAHLLIKHLLNIHPLLELLQGVIVTLFHQVSLPGLTRVSLGLENSAEEIDTLIHLLDKIARQRRTETDNPFASTQTDIQRQMDDFARAAAQRVYTQIQNDGEP